MDEQKKCKECGMPLDEETTSAVDPDLCTNCAEELGEEEVDDDEP